MKERKLAGTLNNPNYFGNQQDRRHMKAFKIYELMQWYFPKSYRVYRDKYWHYTRKAGIFRCDGKVYKNSRDENSGKRVKDREICLLRWKIKRELEN